LPPKLNADSIKKKKKREKEKTSLAAAGFIRLLRSGFKRVFHRNVVFISKNAAE